MRFLKDPTTSWELTLECWRWLRGEAFGVVTWTLARADSGSGAALTVSSSSTSGTNAIVTLGGGAAGEEWLLTAHVASATGRTVDYTVRVRLREA